jgi:hypothetical protein
MVGWLITAGAAAAAVGLGAPSAAQVERVEFDVTLNARLDRSWTWHNTASCNGYEAGEGRRVVTIKTAGPAPVGKSGGTIPVLVVLELRGGTETAGESPGGSCLPQERACPTSREAVSGSVRLIVRGDVLALTDLRYRSSGRWRCASETPTVRAALRNEPRLESVKVRDSERKLRNERISHITVTGSSSPSAQIGGDVTGEVRALARWSLVFTRR